MRDLSRWIILLGLMILDSCKVCKSPYEDISEETTFIYSTVSPDSLVYTSICSYTEFGKLKSGITVEHSNNDTIYHDNKVNNEKIVSLSDISSLENDTLILIASEWDKNQMATKYYHYNDSASYELHKFKNCNIVKKEIYTNNKLRIKSNYYWKHGQLARVNSDLDTNIFSMDHLTVKYEYKEFDEKGNWISRVVSYNYREPYLEKRNLIYR